MSNLVGFFIIVTTAATLHAHGIDQIDTAVQAAEPCVRSPVGWRFALFALGIIGTGLLAIPVLAGSAAYAIAETFKLRRQPRNCGRSEPRRSIAHHRRRDPRSARRG